MRMRFAILSFLFSISTIIACSQEKPVFERSTSTDAIRAMTNSEREKDFNALVEAFQNLYGPLQYKEKRFGFKFDDLVAEYGAKISNAKSDEEFFGLLKQFTVRFKDGHVSLSAPLGPASTVYRIPILLSTVEGRALVDVVMDEKLTDSHQIEEGDEVLEIDGVSAMSLLPTLKKYSAFGNEISDRQLIFRAFARPAYLIELKPTAPVAKVKFAKRDGEILEREFAWRLTQETPEASTSEVLGALRVAQSKEAQALIQARISKISKDEPPWITSNIENAFGLTRIRPSEKMFKRFAPANVTEMPKLFAALYKFSGKTLLLIRIGTYYLKEQDAVAAHLAWYKAILAEYRNLADVLIIDQTHNGGGRVDYATEFVSLFTNGQSRNSVTFLSADLKWLNELAEAAKQASSSKEASKEVKSQIAIAYKAVETAHEKQLRLTETPVPFADFNHFKENTPIFTKPILMLIDELSGSGGDLVPQLMKENKLARLFGERTGGFGGNVEKVLVLPRSRAELSLTRGLFTIQSADGKYDLDNGMIENNGVQPDIHYQHTVKDVRAGYVDYVSAFSKAAVGLLPTTD